MFQLKVGIKLINYLIYIISAIRVIMVPIIINLNIILTTLLNNFKLVYNITKN